MGTHTISNTSTFHGFLEAHGLDDLFKDPCACIFGEDDDAPIPQPGQRNRASTRSAGAAGAGRGGRRGQMSRQATMDVEEPNSPFSSFSFFGGGR